MDLRLSGQMVDVTWQTDTHI